MVSTPLWIVPAKVSSQRIPGKNFKPLAGISPLVRALRCIGQADPGTAKIVVSTDDTDWMRLAHLHDIPAVTCQWQRAHDRMADVVLDVLAVHAGSDTQPIVLVQPTQPLRRPAHLRQAVELLEAYQSVVSVTETVSCDKAYRLVNRQLDPVGKGVERDQEARPTYRCDGTFYGFRRGWFEKHRSFRHADTVPVIISADETCALDTPHDWLIAELLLDEQTGRYSQALIP